MNEVNPTPIATWGEVEPVLTATPYALEVLEGLHDISVQPVVVGGIVRQALLGETAPARDLDILVADDEFPVAREWAFARGATTNRHGNPRLRWADRLQVDLFSPQRFYGLFDDVLDFPRWADLTANAFAAFPEGSVIGDLRALKMLRSGWFALNMQRWARASPHERALILARAGQLEARTGLSFRHTSVPDASSILSALTPTEVDRYRSDETIRRWRRHG